MSKTIRVRLGSPFDEIAGAAELVLRLGGAEAAADTLTVGRVIHRVGEEVGALRRLFHDPVQRKYFLYAVNGAKAGEMHPVRPGDEVQVSSPVLGG